MAKKAKKVNKGVTKTKKFNEIDGRLRDLGGRKPKKEKERVESKKPKSRVKESRSFKRSELKKA